MVKSEERKKEHKTPNRKEQNQPTREYRRNIIDKILGTNALIDYF